MICCAIRFKVQSLQQPSIQPHRDPTQPSRFHSAIKVPYNLIKAPYNLIKAPTTSSRFHSAIGVPLGHQRSHSAVKVPLGHQGPVQPHQGSISTIKVPFQPSRFHINHQVLYKPHKPQPQNPQPHNYPLPNFQNTSRFLTSYRKATQKDKRC